MDNRRVVKETSESKLDLQKMTFKEWRHKAEKNGRLQLRRPRLLQGRGVKQ